MADNVTVDNVDLTDYVVATDDDGTAQHQYVKLEFGLDGSFNKVSAANPVPITGTALSGTVAVSSLPAGTNTLGTVAVVSLPTLPAGVNTLGTVVVSSIASGVNTLGTVAQVGATPTGSNFIGTVANAGTVAISSIAAGTNVLGTIAPSGTFTTKETRSSTGTLSHVAPSMTVVGLLNTNSNRLGFSVFNDATGNLYVGLNNNASTTDYTARLAQFGYYEVPFNYTGTVTGIWSTAVASDGAARITEFS